MLKTGDNSWGSAVSPEQKLIDMLDTTIKLSEFEDFIKAFLAAPSDGLTEEYIKPMQTFFREYKPELLQAEKIKLLNYTTINILADAPIIVLKAGLKSLRDIAKREPSFSFDHAIGCSFIANNTEEKFNALSSMMEPIGRLANFVRNARLSKTTKDGL
jgi:hypothetical protein